jgi:hypothetical protein
MIRPAAILMGLSLALVAKSGALAAEEKASSPESFSVASVHFEQNATDGDVEAVIEAIGGDDGLAKLAIVAPNGQTVVDVKSPVGATIGLRQFHFESPEPKNMDSLKKAFPEGVYAISGATADGKTLSDKSTLTHKLPTPTKIIRPQAAASYTIEIEGDGGADLTAKLPKSVTKFAVPDGFLQSGAECQVGIGVVSTDGNVSVVEVEFTTAGKK